MNQRLSLRVLALVVAAAALPTACLDFGPSERSLAEEVADHRRTWESRRPAAYTLELERLCFCAPDGRGPVVVEVVGALAVNRTYSDSGEAVPAPLAEVFPSVDGLFDILEEALAQGAESVEVEWDETTGVPVHFFIDYRATMADEEVGYRVLAGPAPLSGG